MCGVQRVVLEDHRYIPQLGWNVRDVLVADDDASRRDGLETAIMRSNVVFPQPEGQPTRELSVLGREVNAAHRGETVRNVLWTFSTRIAVIASVGTLGRGRFRSLRV